MLATATSPSHDEHMRAVVETAVLPHAHHRPAVGKAVMRVSAAGLGILSQARVAPCAYLASIILCSRLLRARPQLRPLWSAWATGRLSTHRAVQRSHAFLRQFYSDEELDRGDLIELADLDAT